MKMIDTSIWVTQQALADQLDVGVNTVNNWVLRGKIESKKLPGSSLVLVNKKTISINTNHHKCKDLATKIAAL